MLFRACFSCLSARYILNYTEVCHVTRIAESLSQGVLFVMAEWAGIELLNLSPSRPRGPLPEVPASLQRLVEAHGPIDPVVVRPRGMRYEILSNAETWLAAQRAGWHEVPIDIREDISDADATAILALNGGAGRPDPIERARQLEAHIERICRSGRQRRYGAITSLAVELGESRTQISHTLRLLKLPVRIQHLVAAGDLSTGHARALLSVKDPRRQKRLAERIIQQRLSVREAEAAAQGRHLPRTRPAHHHSDELTFNADPDVRRLETTLSETLGSTTRIDTEKGRLIIDYGGNLEILQGVLERLGYDND